MANPREFKAVLRETWEKWGHLKGEVDPDDLLVLTAIKISKPALYQFLINNRAGFIEIAEVAGRNEKIEKSKEVLAEKLKNILDSQGDWVSPPVDAVLNHLFLHWKNGPIRSLNDKPQSIAICSGLDAVTDYWSRVQRVQIVETVRDQDILELLKNAMEDSSACRELAEKIYTDVIWASKLQQFGRFIWDDNVVRAFFDSYFSVLINDTRIDRHGSKIPGWDDALSLIPSKWDKNFDGKKWWLCHAVKALEHSLNLALRIMDEAQAESRYGMEISKQFYEFLKVYWTENPRNIIKCISKECPYALRNMMLRHTDFDTAYPPLRKNDETGEETVRNVCVYEAVSNRKYGFRPSDWAWMVEPLFEAIAIDAKLLLPTLSISLTRPIDFFNKECDFFEDFAQKWVGSRTNELAQWLVKTEVDCLDKSVMTHFLVAKEWAQKRLAQKEE
ncbi:MAG: hypothetical protein MUC65_00100 [Pontiellaceae bacterium]|nr:hypothetical protein [Pontiellaceae bacterium]